MKQREMSRMSRAHFLFLIAVILCQSSVQLLCSGKVAAKEPAKTQSRAQITNGKHVASAVQVANDLGVRVFQKLEAADPGANLLLSPLSLGIACALVADGCAGKTREQTNQVIYPHGVVSDADWRILRDSLLAPNLGIEQSITTGLFADSTVSFQPKFLKNANDNFATKCETLDFNSGAALAAIDNWITTATKGRIKSSITQLRPDHVFLFSNLYFKAEWLEKFDMRATKPEAFFLSSGATKQVQMMYRHFQLGVDYLENEQCQVIGLPYGEQDRNPERKPASAMYILLPRKKDGLKTLCKEITAEKIDNLIAQMTVREGSLSLPRCRMTSGKTLKPALSELGMSGIFERNADFGNLFAKNYPVTIDDIKQDLSLDVNENGTEAVASTTAEHYMLLTDQPRFQMTVDHPFLFVIKDTKTGVIEFIGAVTDPIDSAISFEEQVKAKLSPYYWFTYHIFHPRKNEFNW